MNALHVCELNVKINSYCFVVVVSLVCVRKPVNFFLATNFTFSGVSVRLHRGKNVIPNSTTGGSYFFH